MYHYFDQKFSNETVTDLLATGHAVDGAAGGLILGRSHDEGGIYFLKNLGDCYRLIGEVEGYEYILNIAASYLVRNSFKDINDRKRDWQEPFAEYIPADSTRVIDTRLPIGSLYEAKYILFEGRGQQAIINKHSSLVYLRQLDELNRQYSYKYDSDEFLLTKKVHIIDTFTGQTIHTARLEPQP